MTTCWPGNSSTMDLPEFSRMIAIRQIDARRHRLVASEQECAALAQRFGLVEVKSLSAELELERQGEEIAVSGSMDAAIVQSCAVTGEDLPVAIHEELAFRFVPEHRAEAGPDEEIELEANDLDEIPYAGDSIDIGEAVAQSLALAIDPYAIGPGAEEVRKQAGLLDEALSGPFAALRSLKQD